MAFFSNEIARQDEQTKIKELHNGHDGEEIMSFFSEHMTIISTGIGKIPMTSLIMVAISGVCVSSTS